VVLTRQRLWPSVETSGRAFAIASRARSREKRQRRERLRLDIEVLLGAAIARETR
jgi:hypothetical protein